MVARITTGISITGIINYNEHKVKKEDAIFFHANNVPVSKENLTYNDKVNLFQKFAELQPGVKTNAVHISLNFDKSEHLSEPLLVDIADSYMEKIGFADQPYLVYQHYDAEHPHIHIVTTNLTEDRQRIDLHDIGVKISEPARVQIEKDFNLVVAKGRKNGIEVEDTNKRIPVAEYSKAGTKAQISAVVRDVAKSFAYSSLAEYNTILNRYGVHADTGTEGSKLRENKGLVYRIIDDSGKMYGHSIKASDIFEKPILKNIEARFDKNKAKKVKLMDSVINRIEQILGSFRQIDQATFNAELKKVGLEAVYRVNYAGLTYGIQFIDLKEKAVFKASDLGKAYAPARLMQHFSLQSISKEQTKAVYQLLDRHYREVKRSQPAFFYESSLIRYLPKIDFEPFLFRQMPELDADIIKQLAQDFKTEKSEKLTAVLQQENLAFRERSVALLNFINADNGLDIRQKMTFLFSNNIRVKQAGKNVLLEDDRGMGIHQQIPDTTISSLLHRKEAVNFILKDADRIPFTTTEKKIFTDLGKGNTIPLNPRYGTAYRVSFPRMNVYTPQPVMEHVGEALNRNYLTEIGPKLTGQSGERLLDHLVSRGMLIQRRASGQLAIGYYRSDPGSYFILPDELKATIEPIFTRKLSKQINDLVHNEYNSNFSARYEMMVKIRQYGDQDEYGAVPKLIDRLEKRNPQLHQMLKEVSGKLFAVNKNDPERLTKNKFDNLVTQIIYNVFVNYPSKTLGQNSQVNYQMIKNYIDRESSKLMNAMKQQGLDTDSRKGPKL